MFKNYISKKCFFLDLDGTVYLSDRLLPFAKEAIEALRKNQKVFFLTNNSSKGRETYSKKLTALGIPTQKEEIITSSGATAFYLKSQGISEVAVLGTEGLREELTEAGIKIQDKADVAVLGFDTSLTYKNLCAFTDLIRGGAKYVATHPDVNCPTDGGFIPDAGSFMALIQKSTGRLPDFICGKPYATMAQYTLARAGVTARESVMVGDRISTDIKFACDNGLSAALVLTGEGTEKELKKSGLSADVFESLAHIVFDGAGHE